MEKLRIAGLERQTLELLKNTRWGRIYAAIYLLIGVSSIFLYTIVFKFNIIFSIFLGLSTWLIISFVVDTILIKTQRIDKQVDWLFKTSKGLAELKKKGIADEQIEKIRSDITNSHVYKKFSLKDYKFKGR